MNVSIQLPEDPFDLSKNPHFSNFTDEEYESLSPELQRHTHEKTLIGQMAKKLEQYGLDHKIQISALTSTKGVWIQMTDFKLVPGLVVSLMNDIHRTIFAHYGLKIERNEIYGFITPTIEF